MEHALYGQGRDPKYERLTVGAISTLRLQDDDGVQYEARPTAGHQATREQVVGVEFTWLVRDTYADEPNKPARARWGIYRAEETHPFIRSKGRIQGRHEARQHSTTNVVTLNAEHPKVASFYGAVSSPLAAAFRRNVEAWATIVRDARERPELRPLVDPMVRYWRLAEGLSDLKDLRWLDPSLVEPDLKRRVPRQRSRPSTTSFDPVVLVPRMASWMPNEAANANWPMLRERAQAASKRYIQSLPSEERSEPTQSLDALIEEGLWFQKSSELTLVTSPDPEYGVFEYIDIWWPILITQNEVFNDHRGPLLKIISNEIIDYFRSIRNLQSSISDADYLMFEQALIDYAKQFTTMNFQVTIQESVYFANTRHELKVKKTNKSPEITLSDYILDHSDRFRAIGIPENINNVQWYAPGFLESIRDVERDVSHLARLQLHGPLSRVTHVKGLRPQLRRSYEALTSTPDPGAPDRDPTRALATRLNGDRPLLDRINIILRDIGLPYTLEIQDGSNRIFPIKYHAFYLRDTRNLALVGLQDVGFGVGQLIPVAAELANLQDELLLMEQPELHLHPAMQANLGELLANTVKDRPGSQLIVETHSEHVVLRLMRLVREGIIDHELVQILYIDQNEEGKSSVIELPIDEYGEFTEDWPGGFFEERMNEI
jgi:hypothetical protein